MREEVIEKLDFNENQILIYDQLIQWHQQEIMKAEKKIMFLKTQLYQGISKGADDCQKDSLISEIAMVDVQIENIHYDHFQDIRALCSDRQKIAFEKMILQIVKYFRPMMKKKK